MLFRDAERDQISLPHRGEISCFSIFGSYSCEYGMRLLLLLVVTIWRDGLSRSGDVGGSGQPAPPVIDISPLLHARRSAGAWDKALHAETCEAIGRAARDVGFFYIVGHNVSVALQQQLDSTAKRFFSLPVEEKRAIAMAHSGSTWRGYFSVGEELTSGEVDQKEGLYFSREMPATDARPLHGPNQWPSDPSALQPAVLEYMSQVEVVAAAVLRGLAISLGLSSDHFTDQFGSLPTLLFRIFHYPPHDPRYGADSTAVGEHTDYGYLTLLRQDDSGGLQIKSDAGGWVDAPPVPGSLVVNLGDALEHATGGLLRATPHRVAPRVGANQGRLSFPLFFDPAFDAAMTSAEPLLSPEFQQAAAERRKTRPARWDGARLDQFRGTYGQYLIRKVSKVFPELASQTQVEQDL